MRLIDTIIWYKAENLEDMPRDTTFIVSDGISNAYCFIETDDNDICEVRAWQGDSGSYRLDDPEHLLLVAKVWAEVDVPRLEDSDAADRRL